MLRILTDEGFHEAHTRALRERVAGLDLVTAREAGLLSQPDEVVLEFAANHRRVVLTHDENTLVGLAWRRVREGLSMPGVIRVRWRDRRRTTVDSLVDTVQFGVPAEVENLVLFLPR